ncbi:uracil-DNA glycosylase [Candidatus Marinimicrobia bacterium PRS2]|nr:uracil-DNA glycosylase [Candidatus Marinimicrobia bacterium PRS2]
MGHNSEQVFRYLDQKRILYGNKIFLDTQTVSESVQNVESLESFKNSICECLKCELGYTRTNFVFGVGNPNADIVFVGEAPGEKEDLIGEPFVGRAGKLLDKILAAINLSREDIYICNVIKCRPPQNRDPLPKEVDLCEPYLKTQLSLINPKLIVALGRIAACTILRTKEPLKNLRNKIFKYEGIDLVVTYHPAALLRNPNFKKPAWEDFQMIRDKYLLQD